MILSPFSNDACLNYEANPEMTWYVVHCGRQTRVFSSWEACHAQVNGYKGACYKGYKSKAQAFEAFYCHQGKVEFSRVDNHSNKRVVWKDVLIFVQAVIIILLLWIIFYV